VGLTKFLKEKNREFQRQAKAKTRAARLKAKRAKTELRRVKSLNPGKDEKNISEGEKACPGAS
jgi:hypothetical protein